jgi:hypothetical protein
MMIDAEMVRVLRDWRQTTQFSAEGNWIFASQVQLGCLPISYPWVWQKFQKAPLVRESAG